MSLWEDLQADLLTLMDGDGTQVAITTATGTFYANVFWQSLGLDGGEQSGRRFWCAASDLPSDFTQGDAVVYNGVTYRVSHRAPDGHGVELVTLDDDR